MNKTQFVAALLVFLTGIAAAQEKAHVDVEQTSRVDIAASGAAAFSKTVTSANGTVTDTPTKSAEIFGTVRYHFNRLNALEVNLGHVRNSQLFSIAPDTYRIIADIYEYTGDYVLTPFSGKRLQPFLFAGAGALRFSPGNTYIDSFQSSFGERTQTSLAFLYGGGTDYRLGNHLALRLQYRGLVYKNPDFGVSNRFFTGAKGHMAEPAIGLVVKF
jgi:opacity protein-like surface antigen